MSSWSKEKLASKKWHIQLIGACCENKIILALAILTTLLVAGVLILLGFKAFDNQIKPIPIRRSSLITATLLLLSTGYVIRKLNPIYSLRRQEFRITLSQIVFLFTFGLWIFMLILALYPTKDSPESYAFAAIGVLMGWIFQDTIKSVVAFFYLRANGLLKIGDWIQVPDKNIDGVVKLITLTTVTIENWDTTTSAFPTYILHSGHFINHQDMLDGKTYGRRMMKTFIIDTGWIHPLTEKEKSKLTKEIGEDSPFVINSVRTGELNIRLFREYVYQMLLNHPKVSYHPRLLVRWLQQENEGMPLELYAFITDTSLAAYEWQQSQIIENIIKSLPWFGLQLYQSASGYDASNNNIYVTDKKAIYEKD